MSQEGEKLLVIVGPTASGKSALAAALAKKLNGEIVSADSRQVYRGLEIGSNYPTKTELKAVPHHLVGFVDPKKTFTVAEYQKKARKTIDDIWKRHKLPILVGGTGFYIQAVVDGTVMPEVPPNETLRGKLKAKSTEELANMLRNKDKKRWETVDRRNPRRLVRAIEIATVLGKVPAPRSNPIKADVTMIGIDPEKELLETAIKKRSRGMVHSGFIHEVKMLLKDGIKEEKMQELGFEYQAALRYLKGEIKSKRELENEISKMTLQYVKRQMTWFRKDSRIIWVRSSNEILSVVQQFLKKKS
ncbi:tRNA (adenosine(37)-N6)-dimethylallyltransferase MiaA [Patescibacteria group bacterium]|nr:tRNA (adenosine(37)-N6)-dimethylallyltransferase MiaA [Patescibacteria group bacterium]MCL5114529.1 tRNA (adenosine(37)-N6)-dimethylallyltransferase MiaA [Patescibacteria group bacterium]